MPLDRVPGQPFQALVDRADGWRGRSCLLGGSPVSLSRGAPVPSEWRVRAWRCLCRFSSYHSVAFGPARVLMWVKLLREANQGISRQ